MLLDRTRIGRSFFAVGWIALAIEHVVFGDFVTGRAPAWPSSIPGGSVWAYTTGLLLMVSGGTVLFGQRGRGGAVMAAVLIASWALARHIPVLVEVPFLSAAWTPAGKALTFTGGALAIAATFPNAKRPRDSTLARLVNRRQAFVWAGRASLAVFFVITGIQHFLFTEFVASLIPGWFPGNTTSWTYFAGIALIAGGLGLFVPQTAARAGLLSGADGVLVVLDRASAAHVRRDQRQHRRVRSARGLRYRVRGLRTSHAGRGAVRSRVDSGRAAQTGFRLR